ncbi:hypothetical protein [Pandoravirus japonicus]|uniref:Uncharacterized protein n=1 Tax=Pandoravirus japonicus TaxID=2823154 RepID=A0A811BRN6_9VIRU|nr:hypothetical protein [Pandoravirus japonicus]
MNIFGGKGGARKEQEFDARCGLGGAGRLFGEKEKTKKKRGATTPLTRAPWGPTPGYARWRPCLCSRRPKGSLLMVTRTHKKSFFFL